MIRHVYFVWHLAMSTLYGTCVGYIYAECIMYVHICIYLYIIIYLCFCTSVHFGFTKVYVNIAFFFQIRHMRQYLLGMIYFT